MPDPTPLYYYGELDDFDRQNIRAAKQQVYDGLVKLVPATPRNSRGQRVLLKGKPDAPWPGATFIAVEKMYDEKLLDALDKVLNGMDDEWTRLELAVELDLGGK